MPIKTIQPFVSNFNAFAGEGFYGNVVQGLVIKQLEDAVFIFGIAIDGTLIFRKRNYPDVSTWEDPKIIIHSNNWHKIYFVTDLGGLLPSGTMNIYKGKFELKTGESTDLQIYDPSILILFSPLNHNPSISIIPAQWNDTISALFEGIINLNSNIEGRICLLKKGNTVTIINNSPASKFSYLRISVDVV